MATRLGYEFGKWLVDHGWTWGVLPPDVIGDQPVVDPLTGETVTPYEGVKRHALRTDESPWQPFGPLEDRRERNVFGQGAAPGIGEGKFGPGGNEP